MQKARRHPKRGSDRLQAHGFRFCFTPLPAVLFTFPSRYSSTIGLPVVLSLGGWCRQIRTGLLRPRPTQGSGGLAGSSRTGLSPAAARLPRRVPLTLLLPSCRPSNPGRASTPPVWAGPLSLAATRGVTVVFLSSGYLDVSVHRVGLRLRRMPRLPRGGLPHSGIRGSMAARASPRPFAACRALRRLWEP